MATPNNMPGVSWMERAGRAYRLMLADERRRDEQAGRLRVTESKEYAKARRRAGLGSH